MGLSVILKRGAAIYKNRMPGTAKQLFPKPGILNATKVIPWPARVPNFTPSRRPALDFQKEKAHPRRSPAAPHGSNLARPEDSRTPAAGSPSLRLPLPAGALPCVPAGEAKGEKALSIDPATKCCVGAPSFPAFLRERVGRNVTLFSPDQ
jgi:hypothetical protein